MSRNTKTGQNLEFEVKNLLLSNNVTLYQKTTSQIKKSYKDNQIYIPKQRCGKSNKPDIVTKNGIIISCKYQEVNGSAAEKIPFEIIKLNDTVEDSNGKLLCAYIVIHGSWGTTDYKLKNYYLSPMFCEHIGIKPILEKGLVKILSLEHLKELILNKVIF